ncbi:MAG: hypothetical protein V1673_06335 [Candidatus Omnitrophota bacterium]
MSGNKSPVIQKILLVVCGTLFAFLASELILRAFSVDLRLLRKTLYYQCAMPPLHRTSSDAQRLFELVPHNSMRGISPEPDFKDPKYANKTYAININALGFRGKGFAPLKKPGVFRIVVFGGSNTFGMNVNDEDTYPAQMQKIFDEEYPGKVEVWNAGMCAYVMSQDVAYAETVIKKFDPDLLIFQDTNRGRRAFHYKITFKELKGLFHKNNELFIENIEPLWEQSVPREEKMRYFLASTGTKIHRSLVAASALYRTFCISLYSCMGVFSHDPVLSITKKFGRFWGFSGQFINNRELNLFTERHKDKKILLFFVTDYASEVGHSGFIMRSNMGNFVLPSEGKPPEYQKIHPPSYVYAWYARELCDFLEQKGHLSTAGLNRNQPGSL